MNASRIATITRLELTQRVRSVAWYVLLGVFAVLLLVVTALSFVAVTPGADRNGGSGSAVYSIVVYFVLLLVVLVSPTLSGNAINGDRDASTLAPVQVTLATTGEIIAGKLLAAWVTGLAFLAVSVPFLLLAMVAGGVSAGVLLVSLAVLVVEILVVAAIGVGFSGILARPLFSVAVTYLVVAGLVLGTLIAFGLSTAAVRTEVEQRTRDLIPVQPQSLPTVPPQCMTAAPGQTEPLPECLGPNPGGGGLVEPEYTCGGWSTYRSVQPRPDLVWWMLAPNPFLILADATPTEFRDGNPVDLFGNLKVFIRGMQIAPQTLTEFDGCARATGDYTYPTSEERIAGTAPSWFVGLALQLVLAALLIWRAWARTRTPARRLPPGTRIA
ncbi:ABC transporter permease [Microbacterium sp. CJ88]|uniref:ABC transporter permease n=1 Tax=Microbacterium sp. CJ88 TaxID=3445672 RepID=UPI003F65BEB9